MSSLPCPAADIDGSPDWKQRITEINPHPGRCAPSRWREACSCGACPHRSLGRRHLANFLGCDLACDGMPASVPMPNAHCGVGEAMKIDFGAFGDL